MVSRWKKTNAAIVSRRTTAYLCLLPSPYFLEPRQRRTISIPSSSYQSGSSLGKPTLSGSIDLSTSSTVPLMIGVKLQRLCYRHTLRLHIWNWILPSWYRGRLHLFVPVINLTVQLWNSCTTRISIGTYPICTNSSTQMGTEMFTVRKFSFSFGTSSAYLKRGGIKSSNWQIASLSNSSRKRAPLIHTVSSPSLYMRLEKVVRLLRFS